MNTRCSPTTNMAKKKKKVAQTDPHKDFIMGIRQDARKIAGEYEDAKRNFDYIPYTDRLEDKIGQLEDKIGELEDLKEELQDMISSMEEGEEEINNPWNEREDE